MATLETMPDLVLLRAAGLLDSDPATAGSLADGILAANPGHLEAALLLAGALRRQHKVTEAVSGLEELDSLRPGQAVIKWELGRLLAESGRRDEAIAALENAVRLEPRMAAAWRELSRQYAAKGDLRSCDQCYARFAALPTTDAHLTEVFDAIAMRRFAHAETLLRCRLAVAPQDVEALRVLAQLAGERLDFPEVDRLLQECLRLEPGFARARFDLAASLHMQQKPAPVLPLVERLLRQDPGNHEYRSLLASTLTILGDTQQAIEIHTALLAQAPQDAKAWLSYGHALRTDGRQQESIRAYRRAAAIRPSFGDAYFSLANLKTFRFAAEEIAAMRAHCARADIAPEDRWHFDFALAKALEDAGDFAESFAYYAHGNSLRRSYIAYDQSAISAQILRATEVFTSGFFAARRDWGAAARDPIFIVGLPRSGSTLLEQILASHSAVEGTRELPDMSAFANELGARKLRAGEIGYPDSVPLLTATQALDYGERYLAQTRPYRFRGVAHFIDKMPNNFVNLGLIHLILPNARIIDARRHPLACGLAVFKQLFNQGMWFSYGLDEIGRYYRDYVAVMAHFDRVLPGRVLRVHYEKMVADPEPEIRRLLDYCGLPFEDGCLRFHENRRVVQTASSEQVRRPIYTEGLDQWRNFEPWLGPLRDALGDVVERYPASL